MSQQQKKEKSEIKVDSSTILDLKAELFKKQEEFNQEKKTQSTFVRPRALHKPSHATIINRGVNERAERDLKSQSVSVSTTTEASAWELSQQSLLRKSAQYEAIMKKAAHLPDSDGQNEEGDEDDDQDAMYDIDEDARARVKRFKQRQEKDDMLVDFDRKPILPRELDDNDEISFQEQYSVSKGKTLRQVEVMDEFGRSRMIPEREAQSLEYERLQKERLCKLEDEAIERANAPVGPEHYKPDFEIRTRGTGFFQFDPEESTRQMQLKELKDMDVKVKEERNQVAWLQAQRQQKLVKRLKLVEERRARKPHVDSSSLS